jgi:hypothetical protein
MKIPLQPLVSVALVGGSLYTLLGEIKLVLEGLSPRRVLEIDWDEIRVNDTLQAFSRVWDAPNCGPVAVLSCATRDVYRLSQIHSK